jgi:hypothetical protein
MEDDQYEQDHAAEYQADDDAMEVFRAVAGTVEGAKSLVIIGPLDDEGACQVQFTDADDQSVLSAERVRVSVRSKDREIVIHPSVRRPPVPFSDILTVTNVGTPPNPPTGRSMGGDAIWQADPADHGTVAFFARNLVVSPTRHSNSNPAPVFNDVALSCRHILADFGNAPNGAPVSMVGRPNGLTLTDRAPAPLDAAWATVTTPDDYRYCEVRALGKIAGVRRPHRRMRVHKFGARTGLTSGVAGELTLWTIGGQPLKVFEVRGRFACVHDSGAAVVNSDRELVGLVFMGSGNGCDLDTVTYVMAAAPYRNSPPNETFYVEYS